MPGGPKPALGAELIWRLHRRWRARLGSPKAITAMAHKLARVLWHLLKYKQPFNQEVSPKRKPKRGSFNQ